jgi:hypothetical protein
LRRRLVPDATSLGANGREDYYGLTDDEFRAVVKAVRDADQIHAVEGGGTRHWLRDYFLPHLDAAGFKVVRK